MVGGEANEPLLRIRTRVEVLRRLAHVVTGALAVALVLTQFDVVRSVGVALLTSTGVAGVVVGRGRGNLGRQQRTLPLVWSARRGCCREIGDGQTPRSCHERAAGPATLSACEGGLKAWCGKTQLR